MVFRHETLCVLLMNNTCNTAWCLWAKCQHICDVSKAWQETCFTTAAAQHYPSKQNTPYDQAWFEGVHCIYLTATGKLLIKLTVFDSFVWSGWGPSSRSGASELYQTDSSPFKIAQIISFQGPEMLKNEDFIEHSFRWYFYWSRILNLWLLLFLFWVTFTSKGLNITSTTDYILLTALESHWPVETDHSPKFRMTDINHKTRTAHSLLSTNHQVAATSAPPNITCTNVKPLETSISFPMSCHCNCIMHTYGTAKHRSCQVGPTQPNPWGIHIWAAVPPWCGPDLFPLQGCPAPVGKAWFGFIEWHSTHASLGLKTQPQEGHPLRMFVTQHLL